MNEQVVGFLRARLTGVANKRAQERIDAECALLQSLRPLYAPWEQHLVTEAINALQEGHRFPECAPTAQAIAQLDAAIERDLEACRVIRRRVHTTGEIYEQR